MDADAELRSCGYHYVDGRLRSVDQGEPFAFQGQARGVGIRAHAGQILQQGLQHLVGAFELQGVEGGLGVADGRRELGMAIAGAGPGALVQRPAAGAVEGEVGERDHPGQLGVTEAEPVRHLLPDRTDGITAGLGTVEHQRRSARRAGAQQRQGGGQEQQGIDAGPHGGIVEKAPARGQLPVSMYSS